jgi:hypothetical protein
MPVQQNIGQVQRILAKIQRAFAFKRCFDCKVALSAETAVR